MKITCAEEHGVVNLQLKGEQERCKGMTGVPHQIGTVHVIEDCQEAEAQHYVPVQLPGGFIGHHFVLLKHSRHCEVETQ